MIGTNLAITTKNYAVAGGVTYDADALAYFTANTAITSDADKTAINTFYLGLKTDGIYTKIKAMYLPIWGSATSSKWNLVNPLDTDAAFRATFATGFTYSSGGITGNGTSAYIDIYFTPSTAGVSQNSVSAGFYSRTLRSGSNSIRCFGVSQTTPSTTFEMRLRNTSDLSFYYANDSNGNSVASTTDSRGFYQLSRTISTSMLRGKNTYVSNTSTSTGLNTIKLYVFALNSNGTITGYETVQSPFFYIGTGLTLTEMNNFKTRVDTLMTYFGINV
jgi:hypothetical protein